ncbi:hypothetical protein [Ulvibacter litoralis]|uniref:Uncharacterized protein n=1 Tax=Ulvibacter litoralis TaxID=227084 RepID=A0A1G7J9Z2_9FLAO|nr:hypothetical protein [Ulvibacter litoralis]GHC64641.1 hypothetical protein GCM10008083_32360 [Ulvibacter litoralis]SDF21696.1 hypothetical protein SAMN05421855_1104 [Ulvibacter litoralis]
MKKQLLRVIILFISAISIAQNGINYKALVKDANGDVIANQAITIQFQILKQATVNVYQDTHNPTTDANGIVIVNIGEGTVNSGDFSIIDWGSSEYFLNVQMDTGAGLVDLGTTQFNSVPYAQHANTANTVKTPTLLEPYILGASSQVSNGRFQFNGKTGWQAANEMCKASYPNEPYARAFTNEQITQAILLENYSNIQNYNSVYFWSITSSTIHGSIFTNTSAGNNGANLGFNSSEYARGIKGIILFDYETPLINGGVIIPRYFNAEANAVLSNQFPCLCGTYKVIN